MSGGLASCGCGHPLPDHIHVKLELSVAKNEVVSTCI